MVAGCVVVAMYVVLGVLPRLVLMGNVVVAVEGCVVALAFVGDVVGLVATTVTARDVVDVGGPVA